MAIRKSAIIPYRVEDGALQIMIVTSSSGGRWVIPKGKIESPLKPHISATKEAFEEAGVLGRPHPICVGTYYDNSSSGPIPTYLLEVDVELDEKNWQEEHKRERKWIDADNGGKYITDDDLLAVIRKGVRCLRSDGEYFKRAIKTYCEDQHWKFSEADEEHAALEFAMSNGRTKYLYITRYDSTVEFSVPSFAVFSSEEDFPDSFSTILLQRNSEKKVGFWCIDKIRGKYAYSCMHNAELKLLDSWHFVEIVKGLLNECSAIEEILEELSKK